MENKTKAMSTVLDPAPIIEETSLVPKIVTPVVGTGTPAQLATLFLNEQDGMIKLIFHFGDNELRASSVLLFSAVFIALQCVTSGVWVSSGLFIPAILSGAAMGKFIYSTHFEVAGVEGVVFLTMILYEIV